jgi:hypothetical protein
VVSAARDHRPALWVARCQDDFRVGETQLRKLFEEVFAGSEVSSVYAVAQGGIIKHADQYDVVILTPGAEPWASAPATRWYVSQNGKIVRLAFECGVPGAAQAIEASYGDRSWTFGDGCDQGEVSLTLTVSEVPGALDGGWPQIVGYSEDGIREIVTALDEERLLFAPEVYPPSEAAVWEGGPIALGGVRTGSRLRVDGLRRPNCTIEARVISSLD